MADVRVKICGITNWEDARTALEAGADYLGFILYPKSPRYIAPEKVRELRRNLRDLTDQSHPAVRLVGVFVNESVEDIAAVLSLTGLDYAQLHGDESPMALQQLQGRGFKAVRPAEEADAWEAATRFAPLGLDSGPQLLIDAYDPTKYGGTGKMADWHVVAALAQQYPRLMLSGGLTPSNVAQAIRTVRPWAVDVSSGVEATPGRKDHDAVWAFISAVRAQA